jgi:hypothetical protein
VALLSIAAGVRRTAADLIHVGRADFGVFQQGASDLTRSLLPASLENGLRKTPGITDVAPIFLRVSHVQNRDAFLVFGLRPKDFAYRRFVIVAGRRPQDGEALLGDEAAKSLHLRPGDALRWRSATESQASTLGNHFEDIGAAAAARRQTRAPAGRGGPTASPSSSAAGRRTSRARSRSASPAWRR